MIISLDGPFHLGYTLESGQAFRWRLDAIPVDDDGPQWYCGVIFNNIVKIRQVSEGIEFFSSPDDESALEPLVREYLRLHDDLDAIYVDIGRDERIAEGIDAYPGMRLLRQEPWENLVAFICSANNNIARISTNVEDMAKSFGAPISMGDYVRSTFPSAGAIAEAGETKLRELGLGFRAKYVAGVSETVARGDLDLFALREASYDEALETLLTISGVGDKVANCVLLFSQDKLEAFPVDVWIDRAIRDWYLTGDDLKMTRNRMRPWAQERFGQFAGYANQYLFQGRRLKGRD